MCNYMSHKNYSLSAGRDYHAETEKKRLVGVCGLKRSTLCKKWSSLWGIPLVLLLLSTGCTPKAPLLKEETVREVVYQSQEFVFWGKGGTGWKLNETLLNPQCLVFNSAAKWEEYKSLFRVIAYNSDSLISALTVDNVDFSNTSLAVITYGVIGSTGYSISLDSIQKSDSVVRFYLKGVQPTGLATGAAMCHPFCLLTTSKIPQNKTFEFYINDKKTIYDLHRFD